MRIYCQFCEAQIGEMVLIGNQEWLLIGGVVVRAMHGVCADCGNNFHWTTAEKALSEMVKQVMEARRA